MGAAWKIFKIAYVSTSLEADPFDRAELRLELLESESYLHGARGVFFGFGKQARDLLDQLTRKISRLGSQNLEQTCKKVEFLCRLARVQAKAF